MRFLKAGQNRHILICHEQYIARGRLLRQSQRKTGVVIAIGEPTSNRIANAYMDSIPMVITGNVSVPLLERSFQRGIPRHYHAIAAVTFEDVADWPKPYTTRLSLLSVEGSAITFKDITNTLWDYTPEQYTSHCFVTCFRPSWKKRRAIMKANGHDTGGGGLISADASMSWRRFRATGAPLDAGRCSPLLPSYVPRDDRNARLEGFVFDRFRMRFADCRRFSLFRSGYLQSQNLCAQCQNSTFGH